MTDLQRLRELPSTVAQQALHGLMTGEPPPLGIVDVLSVGLERDLRTFESEYFRPSSFIVSSETAGSTFKIVEAYYGGGKTHYLRAVERTAHRHNFASAFVGLTKDECPLTRFDRIYAALTEALSVPRPEPLAPARGFGEVIRRWIERISGGDEDPIVAVHRGLESIGDLPMMSLKIAFGIAAEAAATGDRETFEEALVYLGGGGIPAGLRKRGVLQAVDAKSGSLALRSMAALVRKLGFAGLILILDEGDRSLSIVTNKEKTAASNNLVQLINETAIEGAWPGTVLLYSIPSWQNFSDAFMKNQALIQRTEPTGFPMIPPAPRIVLDERERDFSEKLAFCKTLASRLDLLFNAAYPEDALETEPLQDVATQVGTRVLEHETESTFRRLFVQSYLAALYWLRSGNEVSDVVVESIVGRQAHGLAASGT